MRKLALLVLLALPLFAGDRFSYVWVHNDRQNISMHNMDLDRGIELRDQLGNNFIWFRLRGAGYVTRDAATLAALDRLWDAYRATDPEFDALQERLRPLEKRENALDHEYDKLADRDDDEHVDTARMRELERQLKEVQRQLRVLEAEEERLDAKRDAIERDVERKMIPLLEEAVRKGVAKPTSSRSAT
jgi:hypothetical protein